MKTFFLFFIAIFGLSVLSVKAQNEALSVSLNPFSSSTDLTIHNLTNDTVSFKIYNQVGQVVASFFDTLILSGTITVTFTADTLPNGIYFASLTKNSENFTIKISKKQTVTNLTDKENNLTKILISPNPTTNYLTISTDYKITEIKIYTLDGKLLQTSNGREKIIDFQYFSSGIYLLHLKTNDKIVVKKVWKK